jgi:hypothetical protein
VADSVTTVGPASETFGTAEWLRATTNVVGNMLASAERDCTLVAEYAPELRRYCAERSIPWTEFVQGKLGEAPEFLDYVERGVHVLRGAGKRGPIPRDAAVAAARAETIAAVAAETRVLPTEQALSEAGKKGGRGKKKASDNIRGYSEQGGTDLTYTLRRLKRDAPEAFDRVVAGEVSANAAAIESGIRRPTVQLTNANPDSAAARLVERFGTEWCRDLMIALDAACAKESGA